MKSIEDVYGYDRHEMLRSYLIPTVAAVVLLGFAASAFLSLLPAAQGADVQVIAAGLDKLMSLMSKDIVDLSLSKSHIAASIVLVSGIVVALVLARYIHEDNQEYMEAYPYIEDVYSAEQKAAARRAGKLFGLASLPFFAAGAVLAVMNFASTSLVLQGFSFLTFAVAAWLVLHGLMLGRRVNVFLYNYRALDYANIYELRADPELPERDLRLAEKRLRQPMRTAKRSVVTAGFLAALCLYSLPSIETPFYWVAIVVAFAISGILGKYSEGRVRELAQFELVA